ncbi:MAG: methylmalonyl-CoA mutase family protein [Roseiflexaceae bacterium]|nr:methylmalonyl-CoA mutase family protein [Roseiflexaceae bacterium]
MSADVSKPEHQPPSEIPLLPMFAPTTRVQWRALVESELAGAAFEQKLITHTDEGIDLQPIYWPDDIADLEFVETAPGQPPFVRGTQPAPLPDALPRTPWRICQSIRADTATDANSLALKAYKHGATALDLAPTDSQSLSTMLTGIDTGAIALFISAAPDQALSLAQEFAATINVEQLSGAIGSDPLATLAMGTGIDLDAAWDDIAQLTSWAIRHAPCLSTIAVDGIVYHEAGASAVEELAFSLASAVEQVRKLALHGIPIAHSGPRVRFSLALGTNIFMEIAKLRAARMLWSKIIAACGLAPQTAPAIIHTQSGMRSFTIADAHVNLLRATAQSFAAIIGGCNSLEVRPFDAAIHTPDDFSRRLAINTQHLLHDESLLGRVIDPAGGSWYVESLTDAVARKAWILFQEVERRGGLRAALYDAWPQQQISETAAKRATRIATRRDILVGTNMYANPLEEQPPPPTTKYTNQQAGNQPTTAHSPPPIGVLLRPHRDAEPYEALRARAQSAGKPPQAFLATIGPLSQHRARADFALGLLHTAGIHVIDTPGFATPEAAAQAAIHSNAPIVVICSSDPTYPTIVPPFIEIIRAARPKTLIVLAGFPTGQIEMLRDAGIDLFMHARADAIATLDEILTRIGR